MRMSRHWLTSIAVCLFAAHGAAAVPAMVGFQGVLTDVQGGAVDAPNGLDLTFKLYHDAQGGSAFWFDTYAKTPVDKGLFFVVLGANLNPIPALSLDGAVKYLGIAVNGGPELEPRLQVLSVPYAVRADTSASALLAKDAEKLGGVAAADFAKTADFSPTQKEVADLKTKVADLQAQVQVLLAQGNASCTNECKAGEVGCSEDFGASWACGEAKDGDPCFEKVVTACTGAFKCAAGQCTCAVGWSKVCVADAAHEQDSCGKLGKQLQKCGEGQCNDGACVTWRRETPLQLEGINAVTTVGAHLYLAGNGGAVVHYDGVEWTRMDTGTTKNLYGIWGYEDAGGLTLYAVGESGKMVRFQAGKWSTVVTGIYSHLYAVHGLGGANIVAVGADGTVLRWNGLKWKAETWDEAATWKTTSFRAVWAHSASKLWVGGDDGVIIMNDGGTWALQPTPSPNQVRGLWGLSDQNVWAATNGALFRFQTQWATETLSDNASVSFRAVVGLTGVNGTVFAAGDGGKLYKFDGLSWSKQDKIEQVLGATGNLRGLSGGPTAPSGGLWFATDDGRVGYSDPDGKWVFPTVSRNVWAFFGRTGVPADQWAVGTSCLALRRAGNQWLEAPIADGQCQGGTGSASFTTLWGDAAGTLIAAGESGLFKTWDTDQGAWVDGKGPNGATTNDLWGTGPNDLLAVQSSGTYLFNGAQWQHLGGGAGVRGFGTTTKAFWVVDGTTGGVKSFDGSEWSYKQVAAAALRDISGTGPNDVWVVGEGGTVAQYNGTDWIDRSIPKDVLQKSAGATLTSAWTQVGAPVYASAGDGVVYRFDKGIWAAERLAPAANFHVVYGIDSANVLLGGVRAIYRKE